MPIFICIPIRIFFNWSIEMKGLITVSQFMHLIRISCRHSIYAYTITYITCSIVHHPVSCNKCCKLYSIFLLWYNMLYNNPVRCSKCFITGYLTNFGYITGYITSKYNRLHMPWCASGGWVSCKLYNMSYNKSLAIHHFWCLYNSIGTFVGINNTTLFWLYRR